MFQIKKKEVHFKSWDPLLPGVIINLCMPGLTQEKDLKGSAGL